MITITSNPLKLHLNKKAKYSYESSIIPYYGCTKKVQINLARRIKKMFEYRSKK